MTGTEHLIDTAEIFIINGTKRAVDIFVNNEARPTISEPNPLEVGDKFVVDGCPELPFDTYTFTVRPKKDDLPKKKVKGTDTKPEADKNYLIQENLASASIPLEKGRSFSGIFHQKPDGRYQLSIYENDLTTGALSRFTVRNTSTQEPITWFLEPVTESPDGVIDARRGALMSGEWQTTEDIAENTYSFRVLHKEQLIGFVPEIELGNDRNTIVHLVGDPIPNLSNEKLREVLVLHELDLSIDHVPEEVNEDPRQPMSAENTNAEIEFDVRPIEVFQTHSGSAKVAAWDPDGTVQSLTIDRVDPEGADIDLDQESVVPSKRIGAPATAILRVRSDQPIGSYTVRIVANENSLAQTAITETTVRVKPLTAVYVITRVRELQAEQKVEADFADELVALLEAMEDALNAEDIVGACEEIKAFLDTVDREKGKIIEQEAAASLLRDGKAIQGNLGC